MITPTAAHDPFDQSFRLTKKDDTWYLETGDLRHDQRAIRLVDLAKMLIENDPARRVLMEALVNQPKG